MLIMLFAYPIAFLYRLTAYIAHSSFYILFSRNCTIVLSVLLRLRKKQTVNFWRVPPINSFLFVAFVTPTSAADSISVLFSALCATIMFSIPFTAFSHILSVICSPIFYIFVCQLFFYLNQYVFAVWQFARLVKIIRTFIPNRAYMFVILISPIWSKNAIFANQI